MDKKLKCTVRDGRFVEPCQLLSNLTELHGGKSKGVHFAEIARVGEEECRKFYYVRTGKYPKGITLSYCPMCGENISSPVFAKESGD